MLKNGFTDIFKLIWLNIWYSMHMLLLENVKFLIAFLNCLQVFSLWFVILFHQGRFSDKAKDEENIYVKG